MLTFTGKSVNGCVATGTISVRKKGERTIARRKTGDTAAEKARFVNACKIADEQLGALYEKALREIGESNAAVFEIHRMMLADGDYTESVENIIESERVNAEYAVSVTADNFAHMFAAMEDEYMKARAADVRDISERLTDILLGADKKSAPAGDGQIILAEDLTPSETVQLDKSRVAAFVTVGGSVNSHTAILARTMNIPALVGCGCGNIDTLNGKRAAVDGAAGVLYIEPDEHTMRRISDKKREQDEKRRLLGALRGKESITADGKKIMLYANISGPGDLAAALENDAGGIGLFRSEFLYLEKDNYPDEEEQFSAYKRVVQTMAGKRVIIRTLDIGADKQADYFNLDREENPALGYRAIRICLDRPDIFKTQLRAIIRAAKYGSVGVMYPMITSVEEVRRIRRIMSEVRGELDLKGVPYGDVEEGIMIETPAAAVISDLLAPEVDFFSIGTNDLSQYTLAMDRQNMRLDSYFNPHHPAILRLIEQTVKNAHKCGIWAGICGELGADASLTEAFLKMGVDELSVSPSAILPIRKIILASAAGT